MQVHHVFPFHSCIALGLPDLELDLRNLITLREHEANRPTEDPHIFNIFPTISTTLSQPAFSSTACL